MRGLALLLCALAACNSYFDIEEGTLGEDLDRDKVIDSLDSCVAGYIDQFGDADRDTAANNEDPCPLDGLDQTDTDGDGMPDACDPEPNEPGDRMRCPMLFSNADLTTRMWTRRAGQAEWFLGRFGLASRTGELSGIETHTTIESPERTTFDVIGSTALVSGMTHLRLFVRAQDGDVASNLGCEIVSDSVSSTSSLRVMGTPSQPPVPLPYIIYDFRIHVTFDETGFVRCALRTYIGTTLAKAEATGMTVLEGHVAFEADQYTQINSIVVFERAVP